LLAIQRIMKLAKSTCILLFVFITANLFSQVPSPGVKQSKSIMLKGGTIHVGDGKVLANGAIAFEDGKITLVLSEDDLKKVKLKKYDTIIDVSGKHIYPSFIAANSTLGIGEVESVKATLDFAEIGTYNPHVRALIAFNTDSKVASTVRTNGVLYIQVTPRDGVISGKSSVVSLDAWNWEDAVLRTDDGIHVNFPNMIQRHGWWAEPEPSSNNSKYDEQINELKKFFTEAKYYCDAADKQETNLRFEAMRPVFAGKASVYIHADYVKDIIAAVNFSKAFGLKKTVIVGGKDSWKVTSLLKQNNIAVMVNRVHDLPGAEQEDIDQAFKLPYLLQKDSVLFCLQNQGDMEGMNTRNLTFPCWNRLCLWLNAGTSCCIHYA
jgi:imidazolonepropionase-like amidohydrolase